MNIDERLDRLTERHTALKASLESLAASVRETHDMAKQTTESIRLTATQDGESLKRRLKDLGGYDE